MSINHLITIVGPTAIGKTSLSISLAQNYNTSILSADSRQFYKEMTLGTAAPTKEELEAAPHHFIQHKSIREEYSVGDFEREALEKTAELYKRNSLLILVGGSGLYVKSLLEGLDNFPEVDPEIRQKLNEQFDIEGLESMQRQLAQLDPKQYANIDIHNPHRVIRALEICLGTGKPYSSYLDQPKASRDFQAIKIGLTAPREVIYNRINLRVDKMMTEGLVEEARGLYPYHKLNALNTVGYKELFAFFEGELSLEDAIENIKKNSRNFAKRQLTWFRKEQDVEWFDYTTPVNEIIAFIEAKRKTHT